MHKGNDCVVSFPPPVFPIVNFCNGRFSVKIFVPLCLEGFIDYRFSVHLIVRLFKVCLFKVDGSDSGERGGRDSPSLCFFIV